MSNSESRCIFIVTIPVHPTSIQPRLYVYHIPSRNRKVRVVLEWAMQAAKNMLCFG